MPTYQFAEIISIHCQLEELCLQVVGLFGEIGGKLEWVCRLMKGLSPILRRREYPHSLAGYGPSRVEDRKCLSGKGVPRWVNPRTVQPLLIA